MCVGGGACVGGGPYMYVCVHVTCLCVCAFVPQSCSLSICFKQSLLIGNQITRVKGNHVASDSDIDAPRSAEEENRTILSLIHISEPTRRA